MPRKSALFEIYKYELNCVTCRNFQHNGIKQQNLQTHGSTSAEMFRETTLFFLDQGYT